MREILFKAKRIDNNEWISGDLIHGWEKSGDTCVSSGINTYEVYPNTVCQYTGLKDKNDVKIFEGDNISKDKVLNDTVFCIERNNTYDCLCLVYNGFDGSKSSHAVGMSLYSTLEVIGNINDK